MDIKKKGEGSLFIRTSPGRYTLRSLVSQTDPNRTVAPQPMSALATRKPPVAATPARPVAGRTDTAEGGGFVG
jgi:hypothetical protein